MSQLILLSKKLTRFLETLSDYPKNLERYLRLSKDRKSPDFLKANIFLVISINDELHKLRKKLSFGILK